jgi:hypothetical protein
MQIRQLFKFLTDRSPKGADLGKAPTPIDAADLHKVAGGLPNGTWPPVVEPSAVALKSSDS